jgi:hypothetical protein
LKRLEGPKVASERKGQNQNYIKKRKQVSMVFLPPFLLQNQSECISKRAFLDEAIELYHDEWRPSLKRRWLQLRPFLILPFDVPSSNVGNLGEEAKG